MQLKFRVVDEEIYFDSAEESQVYAKKNPGTVVVRSNSKKSTKTTSHNTAKLNITPNMILEHLNKHIISQSDAKKEIAMALYYHSLKSKYAHKKDLKPNGPVMLVGPTGSGKTFIVQKACEFIDTVFVHVDTSSMVPEGIVGHSVADIAKDILKLSNNNMFKATHCVVFLDEMDKLFTNDSEHSDGVASQLLRLVEGTKIKIPHSITGIGEKELDSSNMQFILGGAFQWILDKKNSKKDTMGFSNFDTSKEQNKSITLQDLYNEDIPKELLGRMSSIINLYKLSKDDYFNILTKSESSPLSDFIKKIEFHNDKVDISNETLQQVSHIASKSELGVRAIRQTLKDMFKNALFEAPDSGEKTHKIVCR